MAVNFSFHTVSPKTCLSNCQTNNLYMLHCSILQMQQLGKPNRKPDHKADFSQMEKKKKMLITIRGCHLFKTSQLNWFPLAPMMVSYHLFIKNGANHYFLATLETTSKYILQVQAHSNTVHWEDSTKNIPHLHTKKNFELAFQLS